MSKNISERYMNDEDKAYYTQIGEFIKVLISLEHKTQLEFACEIGVSYSLLSKQLNGIRPMRLLTYSKICDGLNMKEIDHMHKVIPTPYEKEKTKLYLDLYQNLSNCSPDTIKRIITMINDASSELYD